MEDTSADKQKNSKKDFKDKYFIKDVENLTGIKAYTLRIWEQRYKMLIPKRTDTNIRYYEDEDLKYMMNVAILNDHGFKISHIAKLSRKEVQAKTLEISEKKYTHESQLQPLTKAMLEFDEEEFNRILSLCVLKFGMESTMTLVIFPFMHHVGVLWLSGTIHVAHEHFITNLIRQRLYVEIEQLGFPRKIHSEKYLLFVPNGENHDMGLLFAYYMLRKRGQKVIYLGTSTPLDELNLIFKLHKPDVVFCTITTMQPQLPTEVLITTLSRIFQDSKVWLSGSQIVKKKELRLPANCKVVRDMENFIQFLDERMP
ncbi:MAG: MerR family transcriptional regulator [Bacteroidetes bacterium]|nr:MerR family transcriptional regulator [Bacteroidota bacterium]